MNFGFKSKTIDGKGVLEEIIQRPDGVTKYDASGEITTQKASLGPVYINDVIEISISPNVFETFINNVPINTVVHSLSLDTAGIGFENPV